MEDKIKRYLDVYIDTETCNFKCHYCYIALTERFNKQLYKMKHTAEEIRHAFSKERLGGVCLINLCAGGETLLSADVLPTVRALISEGHYVMIVTNGSMTNRFEEVRDSFTAEEKEHLFFKFSFHYLELLRLGILDRFFDNVNMMHDAGCSLTVEMTPNDELVDRIDEIKKVCLENLGALPHITIARDDRTGGIKHLSKLSWGDFKKVWSVFDSELFNFKSNIFYVKRKEFCYAGEYSLYININSGRYTPCNCGRVLGNIYTDKKIKFDAVGRCQLPHCYNGHSWIALGCIPIMDFAKRNPRIQVPSYAEERDRILPNGEHWLAPSFRHVFSTRASESNHEYSGFKKSCSLLRTAMNPRILARCVYRFFKLEH